jgi:hypothetical protein
MLNSGPLPDGFVEEETSTLQSGPLPEGFIEEEKPALQSGPLPEGFIEEEGPGYLKSFGQGFLDAAVGMPTDLVTKIGGGLVGQAGNLLGSQTLVDAGDEIFRRGDVAKEMISEAIVSPEERKSQGLGEMVAGGFGALPALLAGGPGAAVVAGAGALFGTAGGAVQAGEDSSTALSMAVPQATAAFLGLKIPGMAKSLAGTLGLAAAGGPGLGVIADALTVSSATNDQSASPYVLHNPDGSLNKQYFANRIVEFGSGAAFGVYGRHAWQNSPSVKLADELAKMNSMGEEAYYKNKQDIIDRTMKLNEWQSARKGEETWEETRERFFSENDSFTEWITQSNPDASNRIKNVPQALEIIYHTAKDPYAKAYAAWLMERSSAESLNWSTVLTMSPELAKKYGFSGRYSQEQDLTRISSRFKEGMVEDGVDPMTGEVLFKKQPTPEAFDSILLHELGHARTTQRLQSIEARIEKMDRKNPDPQDAEYARLYEEVFPKMIELVKKNLMTKDLPQEGTPFRGFDSVREFFSEVLNPKMDYDFATGDKLRQVHRDFAEELRKVEVLPSDIEKLLPPTSKDLLSSNTHRFFSVMRGSTQGRATNLHDVGLAWYEYVMRDQGMERGLIPGVHNKNSEGKGYQGMKIPFLREKGKADQIKSDISDQMSTSGKDNNFWRVLWDHLQTSSFKEEFAHKMIMVDPKNKALTDWIEKNINSIWDRKDFYKESLRAELGFDASLDSRKKLLTLTDMSAEEWWRSIGKDAVREDINLGIFGRNYLNPLAIRLITAGPGFGSKLVDFITTKGMTMAHEGDKIYHTFKENEAKGFYELKKKAKDNVMKVVADFDTLVGRKQLSDKNLLWPTEEMLKAKGLTPDEISAYLQLGKGVDYLFTIMNFISKKLTGQEITRIPGFMPHYHTGAYKVFLTKNINGEDKTVYVRGFNNGKAARTFAAAAKNSGYEIAPNPRNPSDPNPYRVFHWDEATHGVMASFRENMEAHMNLQEVLKLDPTAADGLQKLEDASNKEWSKHFLEQTGVSGYLNEKNPKIVDSLKLSTVGTAEARRVYDRYAREVAETYKNVMFMEDVFTPLMGLTSETFHPSERHGSKLYGDKKNAPLKNTLTYLEKYGKNFVGKNGNNIAWVDNTVKDLLVKAELDPNLVKDLVRGTRNWLGVAKLHVNPANWAANFLQPVHSVSMLQLLDVYAGVKSDGALRSFAKVIARSPEELGSEYVAALKWARDQGITEPKLSLEFREEGLENRRETFKKYTGWINERLEQKSREKTYMIAFDYYLSKGFPAERARESARIAMGMTMVNYDRGSRPLMYQDNGMLGEAASPFAVFRNAYIGNLYLMLQAIRRNPDKMQAAKPLLTSMATFMLLAGASGIPLVGEYNALVNMLNYSFPGEMDLPSSEVAFLRMGIPDFLAYGTVAASSKILGFPGGVNFAPSMGAIALDDVGSLPLFPFASALAQIAYKGGKYGLAAATDGIINAPSITEFYQPARQITPSVVHPILEFLYSGDMSLGMKTTSVEGLVERTPADSLALIVTGKPSLKERKERDVGREVDRLDAKKKKNLAHLVGLRADTLLGLPSALSEEAIDQRAMEILAETGADYSTFLKRVNNEIARRRLTKMQRSAMSMSPSERWKILKSQELNPGESQAPSVAVPEPTEEE